MSRRPPYIALLLASAMLLVVVVACGVSRRGSVPPLPSDFMVGASIPGWVQQPPDGSRGDVGARTLHDGSRWSVILSREARTRPRDLGFSLAISDDGLGHAGVPVLSLTFDPAAQPTASRVVSRRVPNGHVVLDGVLSPGEWNFADVSFIDAPPQNDLPAGRWPTTQTTSLLVGSAWDDVYVSFLLQWQDTSATRSNLGPLLQWDGAAWVPRPHRANDVDENGVADPGPPAVLADAEDEDRLMIFFPVHDQGGTFVPGAQGCAATCHTNTALDPMGLEAVHAALCPDDRIDVWAWRAASTDPGSRAEDLHLDAGNPGLGNTGGGSGFRPDAGVAPFVAQDPSSPALMFVAPPQGQAPLIRDLLTFAMGTAPGFPVLPPIPQNAAPYNPANFNGTGMAPLPWAGTPPFFGNDYLPPFFQVVATESAADVEVASSYQSSIWTVEIRRRRVTRDAQGRHREDDVQFDDDADFVAQALGITTAAEGLPFSVSLTDNATGHALRETQYRGPLLLSADPSLQGSTHGGFLYIHDYGAGFSGDDPSAFTDSTATRPIPDSGADPALELRAGTDGERLFILARWDDPTSDAMPEQWTWDGLRWLTEGAQDELRILWNLGVDRSTFVSQGGCAVFCHGPGGAFGAPSTPHFSGTRFNETADLWHWQAGRHSLVDAADDAIVDWRFFDLAPGRVQNAAIRGDSGTAPMIRNATPGQAFPDRMAPQDPNANAFALALGVSGIPDSVPFMDVLAGLPPKPPGGGQGPSFATEVLTIFQSRCIQCHGGPAAQAGLNLESYAGVIAGSNSGPVVIPGNAAGSRLVQRITGQITPQMPLGGPPLTNAQIDTLSAWIQNGAQNN